MHAITHFYILNMFLKWLCKLKLLPFINRKHWAFTKYDITNLNSLFSKLNVQLIYTLKAAISENLYYLATLSLKLIIDFACNSVI